MHTPSPFWQRLTEALRDKGLPKTQTAVGRMVGVRQSSTQKWYSGATLPEMENTILLAEKLGVSVDWLLTGRGDKEVSKGSDKELKELLDAWVSLSKDQRKFLSTSAQALKPAPKPTEPKDG